jgi:hypothetical protein
MSFGITLHTSYCNKQKRIGESQSADTQGADQHHKYTTAAGIFTSPLADGYKCNAGKATRTTTTPQIASYTHNRSRLQPCPENNFWVLLNEKL